MLGTEWDGLSNFDLIGGTSTGSIIAAGIATGMAVSELIELYRRLAHKVFDGSFFRRGLFVEKFPSGPLRRELDARFGGVLLGDSERIKTGLMVMTKRLDSGSPWPIHNHPGGRYFEGIGIEGEYPFPNRDLPLTQVIRASTAAPTYFEPEEIVIAENEDEVLTGVFVDGGVSPHNNPSLALFMLATIKAYGFGWSTGADRLYMLSVGTGSKVPGSTPSFSMGVGLRSLQGLMDDCASHVETMMQWMSESPTAQPIDREIGTLSGDTLGGAALLSYARYNILFDRAWVREHLELHNVTEAQLKALSAMAEPDNVEQLLHLGRIAGDALVQSEHLPPSAGGRA